MAVNDYNKYKQISVSSTNDVGAIIDKAQPVIVDTEKFVKEQDGFEDGEFTSNPQWTVTDTDALNNEDVQTSTVKNGSYAVRLSIGDGGGVSSLTHDRGTSDSVSDGDSYRSWIRVGSAGDGVLQVSNSNGFDGSISDGAKIGLYNGEIRVGPDLLNNYTTVVSSFDTNAWYQVEMVFHPSDSKVIGIVYDSNGNELGRASNSISSNSGNLQYTTIWATESGSGTDVFFDDVSYSTTTVSSTTENDTGTGDIVLDWSNISSESDIAVYDQNGNLLPYEIESFDATSESAVLWCWNSWVRDDTVGAQIVYGNGPSTAEDVVEGVWNNTGQNTVMVQHLQEDPIEQGSTVFDSTANNNDGAVETGSDGTNNATSGEFDGAASFDGTDDEINVEGGGINTDTACTVALWARDVTSGAQDNTAFYQDDLFSLKYRSDKYRFRGQNKNNNAVVIQTTNTYTSNNWHHISVTYTTSTVNFYFDGSLEGSENTGLLDRALTDLIGNGNSFFEGEVDAVRVYSEEKSSSWETAEYDASPKGGQVFFSQSAAQANNTAPDAPTNPSPSDGATGVSTDPTLSVDVSDPDGDSMDVSFYYGGEDDGFEDGDFTNNPTWTEENTGGTVSVQSTTTINGSNTLEITTPNGNGSADESINHDRGTSDTISDGDVYQAFIKADSGKQAIFNITNTQGAEYGNDAVRISTNSGSNFILEATDGTGSIITQTQFGSASANTVYKFELKLVPSNSEVIAKVYDVNGSLLYEQSGSTSGATNLQHVVLYDTDQATGSCYFDDVSYSATSSTTVSNVSSGTRASTGNLNLTASNSYNWYAVADDGNATTQSTTWSFTTENLLMSTVTATGAGTGSTLNLSGSTTTNTLTATASGTGETITIPTNPELDIQTEASSNGTGETISISGSTTPQTTAASSTGTGSTVSMLALSTLDTTTATATGMGSTQIPTFSLKPVTATGSGAGSTINFSGSTTLDTATATGTGTGGTLFFGGNLTTLDTTTATGTGSSISVSGVSTLDTTTATATAQGTTLFLSIGIPITPASATATGETISISGSATISSVTATASGTGSTVSVSGFSTLDTTTATATGAGSTIALQDTGVDILSPATASATGDTTQIDVTGTEILEVPGDATATGTGSTQTPVFTLKPVTADSTGTGSTLSVSGTTSIQLTGASATGKGTTLFLSPDTPTVAATASATGSTVSLTGVSTLDTLTATATGTGGSTQIDITGTETLEVPGDAKATGTGASNIVMTVGDFPVTTASATGTGSEIGTNVIGNEDEITVLINGTRIDSYTNIEVEKRLNEVDTFKFDAFITEDGDRALINEGNTVKIIENYTDLLFKGRLTEVEYKSNFRAECEGDGMVDKLLNRKTDRDTYTNTAGDQIVTSEVPTSVINHGTIETAPNISIRFDHDNLARAVAGVANATGYDWFIDQKESEDYDKDYLNFVKDAGRSTVQETFDIGNNARMVERNKDEGFIANDITLLGRGDGINQLEARVFAASTNYTDTTQIITETEGTSFTVADTTQLGATNDNLLVRVGTEVMDVTITDGTTLSITGRGLNNFEGDQTSQIKHYDGVRVWRLENKTTGVGRFSPDNPETGSSIDTHNVKEQRETDKTIVDLSTLEKAADLDLKNRFEDVFRVRVKPTEPRVTENLRLGDKVNVKDLTAMDVDNDFDVVGMDVTRAAAGEGTVLHLANRPRRLTERLSEIESDRDTLNAHMQGATNFNGEHFEDNCDSTHPLNNSVFVPDDVVSINKFELTFKRESFRGYTEATKNESDHTHDIDNVPDHTHELDTVPDHDHDITIDIPDHDHDIENFLESDGTAIRFSTAVPGDRVLDSGTGTININREIGDDAIFSSGITSGDSDDDWHAHHWPQSGVGGDLTVDFSVSDFDHTPVWPASGFLDTAIGCDILTTDDGNPPHTTEDGGAVFQDTTTGTINTVDTVETSGTVNNQSTVPTTTTGSAHKHEMSYGIFEPGTEADVDVDVKVDGNLVTTITNVGVGQEISTPIDLKQDLADPLTGAYHTVELVPSGRSRLTADITEKVFIESTL